MEFSSHPLNAAMCSEANRNDEQIIMIIINSFMCIVFTDIDFSFLVQIQIYELRRRHRSVREKILNCFHATYIVHFLSIHVLNQQNALIKIQ
jgi:hypothetical protein